MNNIDKERDEDYVKKLWRIGYSMVAIAETIKIPLKEVQRIIAALDTVIVKPV